MVPNPIVPALVLGGFNAVNLPLLLPHSELYSHPRLEDPLTYARDLGRREITGTVRPTLRQVQES